MMIILSSEGSCSARNFLVARLRNVNFVTRTEAKENSDSKWSLLVRSLESLRTGKTQTCLRALSRQRQIRIKGVCNQGGEESVFFLWAQASAWVLAA